MANLKVLKLENWMCNPESLNDCLNQGGYFKVEPIFNRPGRYYLKGKLWFELGNGEAYECENTHSFIHDLSVYSHIPLILRVRKSLDILYHEGLLDAKSKLYELLITDTNYWYIHGNCFRLNAFKRYKRIRDFQQILSKRKSDHGN